MVKPRRSAIVQRKVVSYVKRALTEFYPNARILPADMETALRDFTDWISLQEDSIVLDFVWDILIDVPRRAWTLVLDPVWWLHHSGRLSQDIKYDCLELALTFRAE